MKIIIVNLEFVVLIYLSEQEAMRDVLCQHEGSDKMTGWTSLTAVGTQDKSVKPSNPVEGRGLSMAL